MLPIIARSMKTSACQNILQHSHFHSAHMQTHALSKRLAVVCSEDWWVVRAGLKSFVMVQSTRQLSEHTSAGLGVTWQPRAGVGLQLLSSRDLTEKTSADFNWVIGPTGAAGAGLSISRRGERLTTSGRVEVGSPLASTS